MKTLFLSIIFCSFFGLNITAQKNTKLRAPEYNQIILFTNGTLPILKNNKWGLVDSNNVVKFPIEHDTITPSGTGLCIMKKGNISIIISQDFNVIYSGPSDSITYLNPGFKVGEDEFLLPTINSGVKKFPSNFSPHKESASQVIFEESKWIRANHSGMYRSVVRNGEKISKGSVIGLITDPYGFFEKKVKASVTGYIICLNHSPIVNKGDAIAHIAISD